VNLFQGTDGKYALVIGMPIGLKDVFTGHGRQVHTRHRYADRHCGVMTGHRRQERTRCILIALCFSLSAFNVVCPRPPCPFQVERSLA